MAGCARSRDPDIMDTYALRSVPSLRRWSSVDVRQDCESSLKLAEPDQPYITSRVSMSESKRGLQGRPDMPRPIYRRLRGYAFDPSLSTKLDTALINETVYKVAWEEVSTGPVGEYLEVVDVDPASGCVYEPVDLGDPRLLAQDGLPPSEGDPQFHQQMVYAVAMTTIRHFERALGRKALWVSRDESGKPSMFVQRLRIYPHALREANAYYSPDKTALLFGYFSAASTRPEHFLPGGLVFTCLSHDIIAHETTHALLDGMHRRYVEPSHYDTLAFHEAFADIVALFQHFTNPDVLRHQIALTRGDLAAQSLLGELAQQFGESIGNYGALRSAIGRRDPETDQWSPLKPNPDDYQTTTEPHDRGAILVAAVFDAFLSIYKHRVADLLRIATSGSGVLPAGELHPDLISRLATEASKSALHVMTMCIRALDYCPPVDVSFGDYLRAIITADADAVPDDDLGYRIAFVEAFRRRGIYPRDVRALSVESLRWPLVEKAQRFFEPLADWLRGALGAFQYFDTREEIHARTGELVEALHEWIYAEGRSALKALGEVAGVTFEMDLPHLRPSRLHADMPRVQFSLRHALRSGPDGDTQNQLIITMIQTRDVPLDGADRETGQPDVLKFRGGCTLILDLGTMKLRYAISKPIDDDARLQRQKEYRQSRALDGSPAATYFRHAKPDREPFALLHRHYSYGSP